MAIMAAAAVGLLCKTGLLSATASMILLGPSDLMTRFWVDIQRTELLAAFPTPGATTAGTDLEGTRCLEPTCKDIVACGILEGPALTPGALLRITGHFCVYPSA